MGLRNILLPTLTFWFDIRFDIRFDNGFDIGFDIGLGKIHRSPVPPEEGRSLPPGGGVLEFPWTISITNFKNKWIQGCGCGRGSGRGSGCGCGF